ncbi:alpha/beta-hydrolase [Thozetella sp. PMI_491]|nr:alpha/beta-hydrolase [Thozetella sp. PMI_491]
MSRLSFLVIPGSFSVPSFYDQLVEAVASKGYNIRALHLPSVGLETGPREGPPGTMYDDAAFIAKEVEKLADEGKDVVLLAHSYGGTPSTESTKGLTKKERSQQGKQGGIVRMAYMTALVPEIGKPATAVQQEVEPDNNRMELVGMDDKGWLYYHDAQKVLSLVFSDLSPEEIRGLRTVFPQHSAASFGGVLTHAAYLDVPVSYLFCENDQIVTPAVQQKIIDMIEEKSGQKVEVTKIKTGHAPHIVALEKVIDWTLGLVDEA